MTIISPSLLSADFLNLEREVTAFHSCKNLWFHLDIMDGHYVPNLTFGKTVLKNLHKITQHKLDAHLMVSSPEDFVDPLSDIGIHNFTFHWEAATHHDSLISSIKTKYESVGVSLNPGTPLNVIPEYLFYKIDLILIMSVNPGFGGQNFISGVIDKISEARKIKEKLNLDFQIQVDGGVTDGNCRSLIEVGANNLVAGSFIFQDRAANYPSRVESLRQIS